MNEPAYQASIETLRALAKKRARREVRGAMSDAADIVIAEYVKQIEREFDAAVQRGEVLEFVPRTASPRELLGVAAALVLAPGNG